MSSFQFSENAEISALNDESKGEPSLSVITVLGGRLNIKVEGVLYDIPFCVKESESLDLMPFLDKAATDQLGLTKEAEPFSDSDDEDYSTIQITEKFKSQAQKAKEYAQKEQEYLEEQLRPIYPEGFTPGDNFVAYEDLPSQEQQELDDYTDLVNEERYGFEKEFSHEQVKLSAKSRMFLPAYTDMMSLGDIDRNLPKGFDFDDALEKGYPKYLIKRVIQVREHESQFKFEKYHKRSVEEGKDEAYVKKDHSNAVVFSNKFEKGEVAAVWRIPFKSSVVPTLKPLVFERTSFIAWVQGCAKVLSKNIKPYQVVTGNDACRTLYYYRGSATKSIEVELLARAFIYVHSYRDTFVQPESKNLMSDFFPPSLRSDSLKFGTFEVHSLDDWMTFEGLFKKNKHVPLHRCGVAYFRGEIIDLSTLRSALARAFPIVEVEKQARRNYC